MAKQLNVNLAFNADTAKAKGQLQELQTALTKITQTPVSFGQGWTKEIQEATAAAAELQVHLKNAVNVHTGNLDFSKLNQSLKQNGSNLTEYAQKIQAIGPAGQKALGQLANAITQAEVPMRRSNTALNEMLISLKNTARWQLSSSVLHGFMGAIQSAYGYAQDLDESLNNIRIVTGQNAEQMAKFAEQANKAAKALNTDTTSYTNASLIYYQQGLSDEEVAKRTEVTVKMANVAGQTAQVVSNQLTSVWNNFYDGSKSLEYYADVMTALGAATASSTEEIAGGLEKFAAIADTIGLSYEYAAAALATITSNTRQSEEVVGTALKTIFARIQGLNLGETLEDGTTLNKYSEALNKVGISIFESNGEIKKMDDILDEMANKWNTMAKDQQIALAQTVAGVRQYNQLIALMDNWNAGDSDSMVSNLNTAYNATGELQKQSEIYAESWEAAQKRVKAAAEGIYNSLIDKDFFIDVLDSIEKVLTYVESLIDAFGGLNGVLSSIGVLITKVFSDQMAQGLRNMAYNVQVATYGGRDQIRQQKNEEATKIGEILQNGAEGEGSPVGKAIADQYKQQRVLQNELAMKQESMSAFEIEAAQKVLEIRSQIAQKIIEAKQSEEQSKERLSSGYMGALADLGQNALDVDEYKIDESVLESFSTFKAHIKLSESAIIELNAAMDDLIAVRTKLAEMDPKSEQYEQAMQEEAIAAEALHKALTNVATKKEDIGNGKKVDLGISVESTEEVFERINTAIDGTETSAENAQKAMAGMTGALQKMSQAGQEGMAGLGVTDKNIKKIVSGVQGATLSHIVYGKNVANSNKVEAQFAEQLKNSKGVIKDWANGLVAGAQAVMSFVSIINMAKGIVDTLSNPDTTGWEKFFAVLQSGAMILTMSVSLINNIITAKKNLNVATLKDAAATLIEATATTLSEKANRKNAEANLESAASHDADAAAAARDAIANSKLKNSFSSLKTSIGSFVKAYSSVITTALSIAGAVAIIAGTIALAVNQMNAYKQATEDAASAAAAAGLVLTEVKSNYDSFVNLADSYKDLRSGIDELTEGTLEYNQALIQSNNAAIDLINKYSELKDHYTIDKGIITIDEDALNNVQTQKMQAVSRMQALNLMAQNNLAAANYDEKRTELNREINTKSDNTDAALNATMGGIAAGLSALVLTLSNPVGWIVGGAALVGAVAGGLITEYVTGAESDQESSAINSIAKYISETGNNSIFADEKTFKSVLSEELSIDDQDLINALWENRAAVQDLTVVEAARLNQEQQNILSGLFQSFQGNSTFDASHNQDYLTQAAANNYDAYQSQASSQLNGMSDQERIDYFIKNILGDTTGTNYKVEDDTLSKLDPTTGTWSTIGEKGSFDMSYISELIKQQLTYSFAAVDLPKFDDQLYRQEVQLRKAGIEDQEQMNDILTNFIKTGKMDLNKLTSNQVANLKPDDMTDPVMQKALKEGIQQYEESKPDWWNELTEEEQKIALTLDIDENATLESVREAIKQAQAYADSNAITLSMTVMDQLTSLLYKERKTKEDWEDIQKLYGEFLEKNPTAMDFVDFMRLSQEEQIKYIENFGRKTLGQISMVTEAGVQQAENELQRAKKREEEAENRLTTATEAATTATAQMEEKRSNVIDQYNKNFKPSEHQYTDAYGNTQYSRYGGYMDENNEFDFISFFKDVQNYDFLGDKASGILKEMGQAYSFDPKSNTFTGDASFMQSKAHELALAFGYTPDSEEYAKFMNETTKMFTSDPAQLYQFLTPFLNNIQAAYDKRILEIEAEDDDEIAQQGEAETNAETATGERSAAETNFIEMSQNRQAAEDAWEKEFEDAGFDPEEVKTYSQQLQETYELREDLANKAALMEKQQSKGLDDLIENYKDYAQVLRKASLDPSIKGTEKYAQAIAGLRKDLSLLTGVSEEVFSEDFINSEEVQKTLQEVANGTDGAIEKLKTLAAMEQTRQIYIKAGLNIDEETFAWVNDQILALNQENIEIGTRIDNSAALDGLLELLQQTGMTASEIQGFFNNLGWHPELGWEEVDASSASQYATNGFVEVVEGDPISGYRIVSKPLSAFNSIAEGQKIKIPVLGSKSKGGGGYTKTDVRGASPTKTPSGGGGGGGGKKPDKKNDSDKERYHTLTNQLEDIQAEYDKISAAANRAFGTDRLKLIDDQIAKTDELIAKQDEYVQALKQDLPKDKAIMEAYYADVIGGPEIQFDARGNIENFDEIQDAMYDVYNANTESMSDEEWEVFEQKYEQLEKYIEQYEETYDTLREEEEKYQDLMRQRLDAELAKIQYQVELKVMVADDSLKLLDYQLGRIEDDAFAAAEAFALMGDQVATLSDKIAANKQGIMDILGQNLGDAEIAAVMNGDMSVLKDAGFTDAQIQAIREYRDELLAANEELEEIQKLVHEKVIEAFDAWNEKLQENIDKFDHFNAVLTSYKNIIDIVGKAYLKIDDQMLKSLNQANIQNSLNKLTTAKTNLDALQESRLKAEEALQIAIEQGNETDIKNWEDTLKHIEEQVQASTETMYQVWEETLQAIAEEYDRQITAAIEKMNEALTGFKEISQLQDALDFNREARDQYVPEYEKIYELSKLTRDINNSIDDTKNIRGKERLRDLLEEINKYEAEGVQMSEYEVENLQREYDLRMAEIALEEAQNAKKTVRLTTDNEGNFAYAYTTDTSAVDEARQKYEDALFAMQEANHEYLEEMSDLIIEAVSAAQEEIAALRVSDFANQAEYDAAVQAIVDKYLGRIQYGQEQMQIAMDNNKNLYEQDWMSYAQYTDYKIGSADEFIMYFKDTLLAELIGSEGDVADLYVTIKELLGQLASETGSAYENWSNNTDQAMENAGTSTEEFAEDMDNAVNGPLGIVETSKSAADAAKDMATQMTASFTTITDAAIVWESAYSTAIQGIIDRNIDAINACNDLVGAMTNVNNAYNSHKSSSSSGSNYASSTNSAGSPKASSSKSPSTPDTSPPTTSSAKWYANESVYNYRNDTWTMKFDTGGYTGEWGQEGRIAILHQKELVLNAEDTSNILNTVQLTRQLLDTIDLNAAQARNGFGALFAQTIRDENSQVLEQRVHITAEFPSATDHNEIELAFKNLINTASQYANRK